MDYAHIRELQTANEHKATHSTHLNNISSRLQFGTAKVMIQGNTAVDGSGNNNMLNVDSNGVATVKMMALSTDGSQEQIGTDNNNNIKCNVVSAVSVYPHGSANANGSPSTSFNVKLGHTANFKLEDLTSVIDADHSNHSRSIAVGLRCRTDPASNTSGQFIKSTSNAIHTNQDIKRDSQILMASVALTTNQLHGTSIDAREYKSLRILGSALAGNACVLMGSINNSNFFKVADIFPAAHDSGFHFHSFLSECPPYLRIKGGASSGDTYTVHYALIK